MIKNQPEKEWSEKEKAELFLEVGIQLSVLFPVFCK
jgi:hypothetical protein